MRAPNWCFEAAPAADLDLLMRLQEGISLVAKARGHVQLAEAFEALPRVKEDVGLLFGILVAVDGLLEEEWDSRPTMKKFWEEPMWTLANSDDVLWDLLDSARSMSPIQDDDPEAHEEEVAANWPDFTSLIVAVLEGDRRREPKSLGEHLRRPQRHLIGVPRLRGEF